jgi:hypothetical protein
MIDLKLIGTGKEDGDIDFLECYRFSNGRSFPNSYVDFVKKYGYGRSLAQFLIYVPLGEYGDSWNIRCNEIVSTYLEEVEETGELWFEVEPDGSIELVKRWIPFAMSENGYYLFWDPENGELNEFDIYITDFRGIGIRYAGKNLYDVVEKLTDENYYKEILPFATSPLPKLFEPITIS